MAHPGHGGRALRDRGSARGRGRGHWRTLGHHGALQHGDRRGADGRGTEGAQATTQSVYVGKEPRRGSIARY
eukprot:scaffold99551_cov31-Tisochrysis_lutea.AAC.2